MSVLGVDEVMSKYEQLHCGEKSLFVETFLSVPLKTVQFKILSHFQSCTCTTHGSTDNDPPITVNLTSKYRRHKPGSLFREFALHLTLSMKQRTN